MFEKEILETPYDKETWDKGEVNSVKGLHLRHRKSGKAFYLYYRTRTGKQRKIKLGDWPQLSVADARKRARPLMDQVAIGKDPKGEWDEAKIEPTVAWLLDRALKKIWKGNKSGWVDDVQYFYRTKIEKPFGKKRLSEITLGDIKHWHAEMKDTPSLANRCLAILSRLYTFAEEEELRPQGENKCSLVERFPEKTRKRYASPEEIRKIGEILARESVKYPRKVAFIYLLIFTGARPSAIERATRDQLKTVLRNGETYGVLEFEGKTGPEKVVLPPQAMKVVGKYGTLSNKLVGTKMPRRFWDKVRTEAGCADLWVRDWRRTFASIAKSNGVPMAGIGDLLGHSNVETTAIYAVAISDDPFKNSKITADALEQMLA